MEFQNIYDPSAKTVRDALIKYANLPILYHITDLSKILIFVSNFFYFHGAMAFDLGIQRNVVECQKICRENSDCDHFRYRDGKTLCVLLKTDMKAFQRKYCRDVGTFLAYGIQSYIIHYI